MSRRIRHFWISAVAALVLLVSSGARAQSGSGGVLVDFSNSFALGNFFNQARGEFGMWTKFDSATGKLTHCATSRAAGCWAYRQRVGSSTNYVNVEPWSEVTGEAGNGHMHLDFSDATLSPQCTCHPEADRWMDNFQNEAGQDGPPAYSVGYGHCGTTGESTANCPNPLWASQSRSATHPHTNADGIYVHLDTAKGFDIWDMTVGGTRKVLAIWSDGVNVNYTGPISPGYATLDISNAIWVKFVDYQWYGLNNHVLDEPITIIDMYVAAPGGQMNLALGKTASQSSTAYGGVASRAVDLNESGNYSSNSVTHTNLEAAYWTVDLKKAYRLGKVTVFNRTDCCGDRLANFDVKISTDGSHWSSKYVSSLGGATSATVDFAGGGGRYVRVQLRSANYLSLAEVEVFAAPPP